MPAVRQEGAETHLRGKDAEASAETGSLNRDQRDSLSRKYVECKASRPQVGGMLGYRLLDAGQCFLTVVVELHDQAQVASMSMKSKRADAAAGSELW